MVALFQSTNPHDLSLIQQYPGHSDAEVEARLSRAVKAWEGWRRRSMDDRAGPLRRAAELLREREKEYALLMAAELGKPVTAGRAEIRKCAWVAEYYADHAAAFLKPDMITTDASRSYVSYESLGPVLAIMPWNFPFWQVFRFAAPALMAGNTGLLKHAPNVCGCALAIEALLAESGFPEGLFPALLIDLEQTHRLIADPRVCAVTLTGSVAAGRSVGEAAGRALKKVVLELGGSDPYLILEDADLDIAVEACARSRLVNSGQSCIAAKRIILVESVRAEFEARFISRMARARVGDPLDPDTEVGPLARLDLRDTLHQQVMDSLQAGAALRLGGEVPERKGAWYPVTVLADVRPGMPAFEEELFGPATGLIAVRDEQAAIGLANRSVYGLGGAVFTRDMERGERICRDEIEAGACFVNDFVKSDPRLPFGGVRCSGFGRELGPHGIREFLNIKTIYVAG